MHSRVPRARCHLPVYARSRNIAGGSVHGPKAGFNISAPEGWVVDNEAGVKTRNALRSLSKRRIVVGREDGDVREGSQPCNGKA